MKIMQSLDYSHLWQSGFACSWSFLHYAKAITAGTSAFLSKNTFTDIKKYIYIIIQHYYFHYNYYIHLYCYT